MKSSTLLSLIPLVGSAMSKMAAEIISTVDLGASYTSMGATDSSATALLGPWPDTEGVVHTTTTESVTYVLVDQPETHTTSTATSTSTWATTTTQWPQHTRAAAVVPQNQDYAIIRPQASERTQAANSEASALQETVKSIASDLSRVPEKIHDVYGTDDTEHGAGAMLVPGLTVMFGAMGFAVALAI